MRRRGVAPSCCSATGRRRLRSFGTSMSASMAIGSDILLSPSMRSRKQIGTSVTLKPASSAR
jgi:hypothetical protein